MFDPLFQLPADKLPAVTGAVRRPIAAGDIQLWFVAPAWRQNIAGSVVGGALPLTDGDSSWWSTPTWSPARPISTRASRSEHGPTRRRWTVGRQVQVSLRNDGRKTPINPFYGSYLRVYAPAGARLLNGGGAQTAEPAVDGPFEVFSQQIVVDPGGIAVATFDYELPERIAAGGRYRLTWVR